MENKNIEGFTHDQLQANCWKAAQRLYYPFLGAGVLHCIPNDMHAGNVVRWKQYEALGVVPGVWDMVLHWFEVLETTSCSIYPIPATHWFEFKVGTDKLSETRINKRTGKKTMGQVDIREKLLPLGHKFHIASTTTEFLGCLKIIIEPTLHIAKQIWRTA